jgi:uncharacterized RDD family membrane protein YckC
MSATAQRSAPFGKRLAAFVLDGAVAVGVIYAVFVVTAAVWRAFGLEIETTAYFVTWLGLAALIVLAYFTAGYARGRTLGLRVCNLRMTCLPGDQPPSLPRALARALESVASLAATLTVLLYAFADEPLDSYGLGDAIAVGVATVVFLVMLAGNVWMLRDPRALSLQDRLTGMALIVVPKGAQATTRVPSDGATPGGRSPA